MKVRASVKKNVPKLPGYPTQGHSAGNLYGTTAQAASGLTDGLLGVSIWHV